MKNVVQYTAALCVCALWLGSPLLSTPSYAAQADKTPPTKVTAKAAPAKAAPAKKGGETEADIKAKLDTMAQQLVVRAANTVAPSKMQKAVTPETNGYVARYTEVDTTEIVTELIQSTGKNGGKYIGSIKYREIQYECRGKSQGEALQAPCEKVKVRRMNELVRYDGKWVF